MKLVFFLLCLPLALSAQVCSPSSDYNANTIKGVQTSQECFERCASDPKCFLYEYEVDCTHLVSNNLPADTITESINETIEVYVNCRGTQQCKTKQGFITLESTDNNTECFLKCSSNPRCFFYSYSVGNCNRFLTDGDDIDTSTNTSRGFISCFGDEPTTTTTVFTTTTTTLTTTPIATTTTQITSTSITTTSTLAPATTQAATTTNQPTTTTRSVTTMNIQQTTNPAITTNNQEATTRNNQEATTRSNQEATTTTRAPATTQAITPTNQPEPTTGSVTTINNQDTTNPATTRNSPEVTTTNQPEPTTGSVTTINNQLLHSWFFVMVGFLHYWILSSFLY